MRFGEFEVDQRRGVLLRNGVRVKLQDLPLRLLVVLMSRSGQVVTRDELRAELWGAETFVDAEAGLNTAIAKLREALGDDAETPTFVETVPKRGYRFVAPVSIEQSAGRTPSRSKWLALAALALFAAGVVVYYAMAGSDRVTIAVVRFHNETGQPSHDRLAATLTDAVVVALADNPRYGVIGNSPLLVTERIFQDVRRIGEALRADYVVLGQLQLGDNGLLTRAHFIRVSDEKHFWAGKIDLAGPEVERTVTSAVSAGVALGLERAAQTSAR